jgi:two-component system, cell cycle sensor histidine kinase and response regulator CckA
LNPFAEIGLMKINHALGKPGLAESSPRALTLERNLRVLIVDDNSAIQDDFRKVLSGHNGGTMDVAEAELFGGLPDAAVVRSFELGFASQGQEGVEKVRQAAEAGRPYAVAFIDVRMPPGWDGIETVIEIWKVCPDLQAVICTAFADYSWEEMMQRLGSSDNWVILKKPFDSIEVLQLASALTEKWRLMQQTRATSEDMVRMVNQTIGEREKSAAALRESQAHQSAIIESSEDAIISQALDGTIISWNLAAKTIFGYSAQEAIGKSILMLLPPERLGEEPQIQARMAREGYVHNFETIRVRKDGKRIDISGTISPIKDDSGKIVGVSKIARDITERKQLEEQFRQSQKMEAVGQLAGGVAHDFNNLLTVINGYSDLLLTADDLSPKQDEFLKEIYAAGERGAQLINQLLTLSRKRAIRLQTLSLNDLVNETAKMLSRLIGENITLHVSDPPALPPILADAGMIQQVILNLAVNSRDAMPRGGQLDIGAEAVLLDEAHAAQIPKGRAGNFICLSVQDNGCGMPPETLAHLFEPFFTTKGPGKGTGLGLANVFGIVKQHQGWITVESCLGKGTTFRVFLPIVSPVATPFKDQPTEESVAGGKETILLVEDEAAVRGFASLVLQKYGYRVLEAASGCEAMEVWARHGPRIDLLLTDMVMPGDMSGRELAAQLKAAKPALKVLYTSGYIPEATGVVFGLGETIHLIQKPFHPRQLAGAIRRALDGAREEANQASAYANERAVPSTHPGH